MTTTNTTTTLFQCHHLLLRHCVATRSLPQTKQVHAHIITSGHLLAKSPHLPSNLSATYALCGHVTIARKLFDELPHRTQFSYNTMIRMHALSGSYSDATSVFVDMVRSGDCLPDSYAFLYTIKACSNLKLVKMGFLIHGKVIVGGFSSVMFVQNSLMAMYMNWGFKEMAKAVFDNLRERTVVSWNTIINGYFKNGSAEEALMVYNAMVNERVEPDCGTVVSILPVIAYLKLVEVGRQIHVIVEEKRLGEQINAKNALLDMYLKCGCMDEAMYVFDAMRERDVVTWTSMINGHLLKSDLRSALSLFRRMQFEGVKPNSATLASLLSSCTSLPFFDDAKCLHGWAIRQNLEHQITTETSLIDMYAKCNRIDLSFKVFKKSNKKNVVPWNSLIAGCIHKGLASKAIELFKQMLGKELEPNYATIVGLIPAYGILNDFQQTTNMHCYLLKSGFLSNVQVATGLIDSYSKCGNLECAHKVFEEVPEKFRDVYSWSVIIASYGMHGQGKTAVTLFKQMIGTNVRPNEVTLTSALHACSHAGLVDDGLALFKFMLEDIHINVNDDHYTCIVDLLGRTGRLEEAYSIIMSMSFQPSHTVWGALLGACVVHEHVEFGEIAAKWLFELEPENTGNYVLMAKIYSAKGRWKEAENVRDVINNIGLRKAAAHSLIEVRSR